MQPDKNRDQKQDHERELDREQRVLRQLEMQLRNEDPRLARELGYEAPAIGERYSPVRWPWPMHLACGLLFLATGVYLDVTSASVLGLAFLAVATVRWIVTSDHEVVMSAEAAAQWGPGAQRRLPGRSTPL